MKLILPTQKIVSAALLVLLFLHTTVSAQIPGSWQKLAIRPIFHPFCTTFADSMHGIILADSLGSGVQAFRTSDGGNTWDLSPNYLMTNTQITYRPICMIGVNNAYVFGDRGISVSKDAGATWIFNVYSSFPQSAIPIGGFDGGRMITDSLGYMDLNTSINSDEDLWKTNDTKFFWNTCADINIIGRDALFLDSMNFWISCSQSGVVRAEILHTHNAGVFWDTIHPIDPIRYFQSHITELVQSPDTNYLYIIGGGDNKIENGLNTNDDFIKTTDDGKTWVGDSVIGGNRVYRMSSPAKGILWAFVGNKQGYYGSPDLSKYPNNGFADSVFYSSDNGATWIKDSTTFIDDTLTSMYWSDPNHGYITSIRNDSMFLYRYIPNSEGVTRGQPLQTQASITLLNSPVSDVLHFTTAGLSPGAHMRIVDVLGRVRMAPEHLLGQHNREEVNIGNLPPGYYTLIINTTGQLVSKGFVKR
jgi:hypothetical protein